jgi:hypothetical protein
MSLSNVSNAADLSTVQSKLQPSPKTIASAADIEGAVETFLSIITGTVAIATIDPPADGQHMIVLVFTNANPGGVTTGGNIANVVDPAQFVPVLLFYNPVTALYYAK